uniref:Uncharacterized protein n=1 Tax=Setaria viridis TaxID=4556 RepID=A0A4U6VIY3_SETVI|nr:hypothetical protein SEVIR_3G345320v2 [Setaria viridis]
MPTSHDDLIALRLCCFRFLLFHSLSSPIITSPSTEVPWARAGGIGSGGQGQPVRSGPSAPRAGAGAAARACDSAEQQH